MCTVSNIHVSCTQLSVQLQVYKPVVHSTVSAVTDVQLRNNHSFTSFSTLQYQGLQQQPVWIQYFWSVDRHHCRSNRSSHPHYPCTYHPLPVENRGRETQRETGQYVTHGQTKVPSTKSECHAFPEVL